MSYSIEVQSKDTGLWHRIDTVDPEPVQHVDEETYLFLYLFKRTIRRVRYTYNRTEEQCREQARKLAMLEWTNNAYARVRIVRQRWFSWVTCESYRHEMPNSIKHRYLVWVDGKWLPTEVEI